MSAPNSITLPMTLHSEDGAGFRVSVDGDERTSVVLPKSQVTLEVGMGRTVRVTMPKWLAADRNLTTAADDRQGSFL